jgi:hypothetical protein
MSSGRAGGPPFVSLRTIDRLARLRLAARRRGLDVRPVRVPDDVRELARFLGLAEALGIEARRQPEEREQRGGVEEER